MNTNFFSPWFDLAGIEPEPTVSVADALSARPLTGILWSKPWLGVARLFCPYGVSPLPYPLHKVR